MNRADLQAHANRIANRSLDGNPADALKAVNDLASAHPAAIAAITISVTFQIQMGGPAKGLHKFDEALVDAQMEPGDERYKDLPASLKAEEVRS